MKTAFIVLGAQRSGTSVTSHLLSKFGINFGNAENFLQAEHNPTFLELKWVNQYNDRLINTLGYKYTDFFLPIETDYSNANTLALAAELPSLIQHEWNDESHIGIKDPRFSLTFPVWESALLAEGYTLKIIFVFRCPAGFLRSNQKLFNNWAGWDEQRHLQLWLQLNLAGIYFARHYPIYFIRYGEMMNQPLHVAEQVADFFDLDKRCCMTAAAVVDGACYHHKQSNATSSPEANHYYTLLCSNRLSATDYLIYRSSVLAA